MGACSSKPKTSDFYHPTVEKEMAEEEENCFSMRFSGTESISSDYGITRGLIHPGFDQSLCQRVEQKLSPNEDHNLHYMLSDRSEERRLLLISCHGLEIQCAEKKDESVFIQKIAEGEAVVANGERHLKAQKNHRESIRDLATASHIAEMKKELLLPSGVIHHIEENSFPSVETFFEENGVRFVEENSTKNGSKCRELKEDMQSIAHGLMESKVVLFISEKQCNESINKAMLSDNKYSNNNSDLDETEEINKELSFQSGALDHQIPETKLDVEDERHSFLQKYESKSPQDNTKEVKESINCASILLPSCEEIIKSEEITFCSKMQGAERKEALGKGYWHLEEDILSVNAMILREGDLEHTPILRDSLMRLCNLLARESLGDIATSQRRKNVDVTEPFIDRMHADSRIAYCNAQGNQDSDCQGKNVDSEVNVN